MSLNNLFKQRLHIISSIDPQHTNSGGIAIVLNKNIANVHNIKKYVLIPGCAMLVLVPWHQNTEIHILVIYAPNSVSENQQFWSDIVSKLRDPIIPHPDVLLGDFNFVEDALDRLPSRSDSEQTPSQCSNQTLTSTMAGSKQILMTLPSPIPNPLHKVVAAHELTESIYIMPLYHSAMTGSSQPQES
jgi:hypothetical protein